MANSELNAAKKAKKDEFYTQLPDISYDMRFFTNLTDAERSRFLDYRLMVYLCDGSDEEKLRWFQTINIAGERLTEQELRNAVYSGPFVTDAKRHFSKPGCPAQKIASSYMDGSPIRQDYLETALRWIGGGADPRFYMAIHQHDPNANPLWLYFQQVVNWAKATFPVVRAPMKKVPWGLLYNKFVEVPQDPKALEARIARLVADSDVQRKPGIWEYVLDGDERHLGIRAFDDNTRLEAYERQHGVCPLCGAHFELAQMEADHITPWRDGGRTVAANCQMLCRECNRRKGAK